MHYHEKHRSTVAAKPSASLLYNNLTYAQGRLAYAHLRQAVIIDTKAVNSSTADNHCKLVDTQDADLVSALTMFHHHGRAYLAVACETCLKIYNASGSQLLFVWSAPGPTHADGGSCGFFLRGISSNIAADGSVQIVVGSSMGALHVLAVEADDRFRASTSLQSHTAPITCITSSYQCRRGAWSDDLVCNLLTADETGRVAIWEAADSSRFTCKLTIELNGVPCTSLVVRSTFVVCARLDGKIDVYGLNDGTKRAEFVGHSRWISAMDIHPEKDIVVTASEDCSLCVWTLPIATHKVHPVFSTVWLNSMITGVTFCGNGNDDIAAVAYDSDELVLWKA